MKNMIWKTDIIGNINRQKWYFVAFFNLELTVVDYSSLPKTLYKIYSVAIHFEKKNSKCVKFRTNLTHFEFFECVKFWNSRSATHFKTYFSKWIEFGTNLTHLEKKFKVRFSGTQFHFSSPEPKTQVSYCHSAPSVRRRPSVVRRP